MQFPSYSNWARVSKEHNVIGVTPPLLNWELTKQEDINAQSMLGMCNKKRKKPFAKMLGDYLWNNMLNFENILEIKCVIIAMLDISQDPSLMWILQKFPRLLSWLRNTYESS